MIFPDLYKCKVAVIGLGYVGLPLALEIAKRDRCKFTGKNIERHVIGFDCKLSRIEELQKHIDKTGETSFYDLKNTKNLVFSNNSLDINSAEIFIVTVPTPIDKNKQPNLEFLINASKLIGQTLKTRNSEITPIIIFESTVFPGATEEICAPTIQENSGLIYKKDFLCAYSPERINPGDKTKRINEIIKITSGCNVKCADWVDRFYKSIVDAGTYSAKSIKIAEAAKIIENIQRDINIALVNELSIIFTNMNIDTLDVLDAAATKWNFLNFRPGLVGGHCIGVDPYYLTWKTEQKGYKPEMILSGRKVNEKMINFVLRKIIIHMEIKKRPINGAKMLILGCTFKEDCPDVRNSKIIDLATSAKKKGFDINIYDSIADVSDLDEFIKKEMIDSLPENKIYDVLLIAVAHKHFKEISYKKYLRILNDSGFIFDLKGILKERDKVLRP